MGLRITVLARSWSLVVPSRCNTTLTPVYSLWALIKTTAVARSGCAEIPTLPVSLGVSGQAAALLPVVCINRGGASPAFFNMVISW